MQLSLESTIADNEIALVDQLTREFDTALNHVKELRRQTMISTITKNMEIETYLVDRKNSTKYTMAEVAYYGIVANQIVEVLHHLKTITEDISLHARMNLLVSCGDKLVDLCEYRAATYYFYDRVLSCMNPHEDEITSYKSVELYIRGLFGSSICKFHIARRRDHFVRYPGTIEECLLSLSKIKDGIVLALMFENRYQHQFAWLIFNGTILIHSIAKPLQLLGFEREVVSYFQWCILSLDNVVSLSTVGNLLWRMQLYSCIYECYDAAAAKIIKNSYDSQFETSTRKALVKLLDSRRRVVESAQNAVVHLRTQEEIDLPLPAEVEQTLQQAEEVVKSLSFLSRLQSIPETPLSAEIILRCPTQTELSHSFQNEIQQYRLAFNIVCRRAMFEKLSHKTLSSTNSCLFWDGSTNYRDLLCFLCKTATHQLGCRKKTEIYTESDNSMLQKQQDSLNPLPLQCYLMLVNYCFEQRMRSEFTSLIQFIRLQIDALKLRMKRSYFHSRISNYFSYVKSELDLYEKLHILFQMKYTCDLHTQIDEPQRQDDQNNIIYCQNMKFSCSAITAVCSAIMRHAIGKVDEHNAEINGMAITLPRRDHYITLAIALWKDFADVVARDLECVEIEKIAVNKSNIIKLHSVTELFLCVFEMLQAFEIDDILLLGEVALRLVIFFRVQAKFRLASQIARSVIAQLDQSWDDVVSCAKNFKVMTSSLSILHPLSRSTLSHDASHESSYSDATTDGKLKRSVGVGGVGSQLGSIKQEASSLYIDLLLQLFQSELDEAAAVDKQTYKHTRQKVNLHEGSMLSCMKKRLKMECGRNRQKNALLEQVLLTHPSENLSCKLSRAQSSLRLLRSAQSVEEELVTMVQQDVAKNIAESCTPQAPVVVIRATTYMILKIVPFYPTSSLTKGCGKNIAYYMIYAKESGIGPCISQANNAYPGTGQPIYSPDTLVCISGLIPNERYSYSVAAYDSNSNLVGSISKASDPIVAMHCLPQIICYGYLACIASSISIMTESSEKLNVKSDEELSLQKCAEEAASNAISSIISFQYGKSTRRPIWMANPLYHSTLSFQNLSRLSIVCVDLLAICLSILINIQFQNPNTDKHNDHRRLLNAQIDSMSKLNYIHLAIEMAMSIGNFEAIRHLSVTGYQILSPLLLQLKAYKQSQPFSSCGGKTIIFPSVLFLYLCLSELPEAECDSESIKIMSRLILTLMEYLGENRHLYTAVRNTLEKNLRLISRTSDSSIIHSDFEKAQELYLLGCIQQKSKSNSTVMNKNDSVEVGVDIEDLSLKQLFEDGKYNIMQIKILLDQRTQVMSPTCPNIIKALEVLCRLCHILISQDNDSIAMDWLTDFSFAGDVGSHTFHKMVENDAKGCCLYKIFVHETPSDSITAGENIQTHHSQSEPDSPIPLVIDIDQDIRDMRESMGHQNDLFLYSWSGEVLFLQALIIYRKICNIRREKYDISNSYGPHEDSFNEIFHSSKDFRSMETSPQIEAIFTENKSTTNLSIDLHQLIDKLAASSKFFSKCQSWNALLANCQMLWNAILKSWASPKSLATEEACSLSITKSLETCITCLIDMKDIQSICNVKTSSNILNELQNDDTWFSYLLNYSLQVFCCCSEWESIVAIANRGHHYVAYKSRQETLQISIYAQTRLIEQSQQLLHNAQNKLESFIREFQEEGSKRTKKKSRLVMQEILTQEEREFEVTKSMLDEEVAEFRKKLAVKQDELSEMQQLLVTLRKSIGKSDQLLVECHSLVQSYCLNHERHEINAQFTYITGLYTHCMQIARQKKQHLLMMQALEEKGDFELYCGKICHAMASWQDCLDQIFSSINVHICWREVFSGDQLASRIYSTGGLWIAIRSCCVIMKLALQVSGTDRYLMVEYGQMAGEILTSILQYALPHPSLKFMFGSYEIITQLWPKYQLLTNFEQGRIFEVCLMAFTIPQILLEYGKTVHAMPAIAFYEHISLYYLEDLNHVTNARRLRVECLLQCGRFMEASNIIARICDGIYVPSGTTCSRNIEFSMKSYEFHDNLPVDHIDNESMFNWYTKLNVTEIIPQLKSHYNYELCQLWIITFFHIAVALIRNLPPTSKSCSEATKHTHKAINEYVKLLPDTTESETFGMTSLYFITCIRSEVFYIQAILSFHQYDWEHCIKCCEQAIEKFCQNTEESQFEAQIQQAGNILTEIPWDMLQHKGGFVSKCRKLQGECEFFLGHYQQELNLVNTSLEECKVYNDVHFQMQFRLQEVYALAYTGDIMGALQNIHTIQLECKKYWLEETPLFVESTLLLADLLRYQNSQPPLENEMESCLSLMQKASHIMDSLLQQHGWIGIKSNKTYEDVRCSIYLPLVTLFIHVKLSLTRALIEEPEEPKKFNNTNEMIKAMIHRSNKALREIDTGLLAFTHTTAFQPGIRESLLLLKGCILRKSLYYKTFCKKIDDNSVDLEGNNNIWSKDPEKVQISFDQCAATLLDCIQVAINQGGHDRQIIRWALMELVELYSYKLCSDKESGHIQAEYHYLMLSLQIKEQECLLLNSTELQKESLSATITLPTYIEKAIGTMNSNLMHDGAAKLSTASVLNYFLHCHREKQVLPNSLYTVTKRKHAVEIHNYLLQAHPAYKDKCCLSSVPIVPASDPEIGGGSVCTHWRTDLIPAINYGFMSDSENCIATLHYSLGTTTTAITENQIEIKNSAREHRLNLFASQPFVGKINVKLDKAYDEVIAHIRELRIEAEDEHSNRIDRNSFSHRFNVILCNVQRLFGRTNSYQSTSQVIVDVDGINIPIEFSNDIIVQLDDIFSLDKGVKARNNLLCYFLRDLLYS